MKYIDVASQLSYPDSAFDPIPLTVDLSDGILVSLITLYRKGGGHFSFDINKLITFRDKYLNVAKSGLWIDSGGFNLLSEIEMSEESLKNYIDAYCQFITEQCSSCEKIFSLDLPVAKASPKVDNSWFNSCANIKKWNTESQRFAIKAIEKTPQLKEKYTFVYQFRTPTLFNIWREIYRDLNIGEYIKHRAVGGLVGIHEASRKDNKKVLLFSPVIGPAFNCFKDYLESCEAKQNFTLHFLGVRNSIDKFIVIFLERLFTHYLSSKGSNAQACFSIDTRSNAKDMNVGLHTYGIYSFDPCRYVNKIHKDYKIRDIHCSRIQNAYRGHSQYISGEISEKISWEERVNSTSDFYPLSVYSSNSLNDYFDWFINYNNILMLMLNAQSKEELEGELDDLFDRLLPIPTEEDNISLKEVLGLDGNIDSETEMAINGVNLDEIVNPTVNAMTPLYDIFKSPKFHNKKTNLDSKIKHSLSRIYDFHRWYAEGRDTERLNELMLQFIDDIGLIDDLV